MLCWGKADCGALGVGGVDELTLPTPTWNKALSDKHVSVVGKHGTCMALLLMSIVSVTEVIANTCPVKCDRGIVCIRLKVLGCLLEYVKDIYIV